MAVAEVQTAVPEKSKKKILPPEVVVPKQERVRFVLTDPQTIRDDGKPGGVRVVSVGEVVLDGTAAYGFKNLDKALASGKLKVERA